MRETWNVLVGEDWYEAYEEIDRFLKEVCVSASWTLLSPLPGEVRLTLLRGLGLLQLFLGWWHEMVKNNDAIYPFTLHPQWPDDAVMRDLLVGARTFGERVSSMQMRTKIIECSAVLGAYCSLLPEGEEGRESDALDALIKKDVVQAIIRALGTEKLKRVEIIRRIEPYQAGGHVSGSLALLAKHDILVHERPHYSLNPRWYQRFGICPDKDGQ